MGGLVVERFIVNGRGITWFRMVMVGPWRCVRAFRSVIDEVPSIMRAVESDHSVVVFLMKVRGRRICDPD